MKITVLAPHPDDAGFSIGGILDFIKLYSDICVITIFGKTDYLGIYGVTSNWQQATQVRFKEEQDYCKTINAYLVYIGYEDAIIRFHHKEKDIILSPKNNRNLILDTELVNQIKSIINIQKPDFIFVPLGIGNHIDHLLTNSIGQIISQETILPIIYYEDLPYAARVYSSEVTKHIKYVDKNLVSIDIILGHHLAKKLENIKLYHSQITKKILIDIESYARYIDNNYGGERLWSDNNTINYFAYLCKIFLL